jgi:hypothetical protein
MDFRLLTQIYSPTVSVPQKQKINTAKTLAEYFYFDRTHFVPKASAFVKYAKIVIKK